MSKASLIQKLEGKKQQPIDTSTIKIDGTSKLPKELKALLRKFFNQKYGMKVGIPPTDHVVPRDPKKFPADFITAVHTYLLSKGFKKMDRPSMAMGNYNLVDGNVTNFRTLEPDDIWMYPENWVDVVNQLNVDTSGIRRRRRRAYTP